MAEASSCPALAEAAVRPGRKRDRRKRDCGRRSGGAPGPSAHRARAMGREPENPVDPGEAVAHLRTWSGAASGVSIEPRARSHRPAASGFAPAGDSRVRALATLLLGLGAGCAPHLIWSGHDARRELAAEVFATGSQQWLQSGGEVGPRFEQVDTSQVVFAPDGSRLAYPAMREGRWWMIVGEERLGPWEDVAEPRFGGNGRRFAFLARAPDGWHVVTDGTAGPALE